MIGEGSVTIAGNSDSRWRDERVDVLCRVVDCLKLKSIDVGDYSFSDYHSFELSHLLSIQSINVGCYSFRYARFLLIDWCD